MPVDEEENGVTAEGCRHLKEGEWDLEELRIGSDIFSDKTNCSHRSAPSSNYGIKLSRFWFNPRAPLHSWVFMQLGIILDARGAGSWRS